jgi:apolipoprotein N-acyltransferase
VGTLRAEDNAKTGEEEYFNSVLVMDRATPGVGWHDKHHLVPFSEFFPVPGFVRKWLRLMNLPYSDFNRGAAQQAPLEAAGQRIAANICYEDAYGSTQLGALRTATLLVNVTNDAWFGHSPARYQHLQISRMRAREAGRPMVRAANDGVSAVIGSRGEIVAKAPEYEANVMRASVQPRIGLTPYARTGNWLVVCLALVFAVAGAYVGRRTRQA